MNDLVTPFLAVFLSERMGGARIDAWSTAPLTQVRCAWALRPVNPPLPPALASVRILRAACTCASRMA